MQLTNQSLNQSFRNASGPPADAWQLRVGNSFKIWSAEDYLFLRQVWLMDSNSDKKLKVILLSELLKRTPFAIVARLFRVGEITKEEGDSLCEEIGTRKRLSEQEFAGRPNRNEIPEPTLARGSDIGAGNQNSTTLRISPNRVCHFCGLPISTARLKAVPTATSHVDCKSAYEGDYRRYADEGPTGSREEHLNMRAQLSRDMSTRNSIYSL
jgi:hypothetical protein